MLDYAALQALAAVLREGSFERAAQRLHVTPSAVSQRIKQLEERAGQVLVQRGSPCTGTEAGRHLCLHLEQVALLEHQLRSRHPALLPAMAEHTPTLKLAVNADSLATWFMQAVAAFTVGGTELLDLRIDDQEHTGLRLREGEVLAAVTTSAAPMAGCDSWPLGTMRYIAATSPAFMQRHFAQGVTAQALARAPMMVYDRNDRLQEQWLQTQGLAPSEAPPRHFLPSAGGYVRACEIGMGWGMHPMAMVQEELAQGRLVELRPEARIDVPLFWAHPRSARAALQRLTDCVLAAAHESLH